MAKVEVSLTCGCGEVFRSAQEDENVRGSFGAGKAVGLAMRHVDLTGHTLDTLGSLKITPSEARVQTEELEEKYNDSYKPDFERKPKPRNHPHRRVLHERKRENVR